MDGLFSGWATWQRARREPCAEHGPQAGRLRSCAPKHPQQQARAWLTAAAAAAAAAAASRSSALRMRISVFLLCGEATLLMGGSRAGKGERGCSWLGRARQRLPASTLRALQEPDPPSAAAASRMQVAGCCAAPLSKNTARARTPHLDLQQPHLLQHGLHVAAPRDQLQPQAPGGRIEVQGPRRQHHLVTAALPAGQRWVGDVSGRGDTCSGEQRRREGALRRAARARVRRARAGACRPGSRPGSRHPAPPWLPFINRLTSSGCGRARSSGTSSCCGTAAPG